MAPIDPVRTDIPNDDELDDILNGIVDGQDVFDTSNIRAEQEPQTTAITAPDSGLGIDEEIKIVRKRQPIPKLDENLLLSTTGIHKLQRISKERLRFKGKGHEYGDIARMLNMYQLWLDDMYPRAKFADGLAMIEKLGHSKRIQYMRKVWIDEGKPKTSVEDDLEEVEEQQHQETTEPVSERMEDVTTQAPEEDSRQADGGEPLHQHAESPRPSGDDNPEEDELDALLAENAAPNNTLTSAEPAPRTTNREEEMFADEMEAMAEMEGMW